MGDDVIKAQCIEQQMTRQDEHEIHCDKADEVKVRRLEKWQGIDDITMSQDIDSKGIYLISGGLGGIGLGLCDYMISHGAKHIILLSRSEPSKEIEAQLDVWRNASINVDVRSIDVGDEQSVRQLFSEINQQGRSCGIFHAAGIINDKRMEEQSWGDFKSVSAGKSSMALIICMWPA